MENEYRFQRALPVWVKDGSTEPMNTHLLFRAELSLHAGDVLAVASFDFYRLKVNGRFVGSGPARAAKGYARVDEYDLSPYRTEGTDIVTIEAAGYACSSLSTCKQPSMLTAEIRNGDAVSAATGVCGFSAFLHSCVVKKTERYSVQRHFCESMDYTLPETTPIEIVPVSSPVVFLNRGVRTPDYSEFSLSEATRRGTFVHYDNMEKARVNAYSFNPFTEHFGTFPREEVRHDFAYVTHSVFEITGEREALPISLTAGKWCRFDFSQIEVGFLQLSLAAEAETDLVIAFTEYSAADSFSFNGMNAQNVITLRLPAGKALDFESLQPYSFQTVAVLVREGALQIRRFGFRSYVCDTAAVPAPAYRDADLCKIYKTALRTFAHNAVDLFTDCPSRERAGWLCDSYFTGKAEYFFFGESTVETNFLENFLLIPEGGPYPDGVIPMVYPADPHQNDKFIPQWSMWFVLESKEYLTERRPKIAKERFRKPIFDLLRFFAAYENEDGLLERLPSWNYVESLDANEWTWDVSYPTNFLYAAVLDATADLFGGDVLREKAEKIRKTVREKSFNGEVFVDHACRDENGILRNRSDVSEACQYYACLFGGVDLSLPRYAALRRHIETDFSGYGTPLCRVDAFIGLYLRMALLHTLGWQEILIRDLKRFYLPMCDKTGTFWEHCDYTRCSLDHGFTSYIASVLPRD